MHLGSLDQRGMLQRHARPVQRDAHGAIASTWEDVAEVDARVRVARAQEGARDGQLQARRDIEVRIRFRGDVDSTWRFVWKVVYAEPASWIPLEIEGVLPVGREWTDMQCVQGVRDGR